LGWRSTIWSRHSQASPSAHLADLNLAWQSINVQKARGILLCPSSPASEISYSGGQFVLLVLNIWNQDLTTLQRAVTTTVVE
jgi:hypothetical protein